MLRLPIVLILNVFNVVRFGLSRLGYLVARIFSRGKKRYVRLELGSDYAFGPAGGLRRWFKSENTFLEFTEDIKALAADDDVDGVILVPDNIAMGSARTAEIRDGIDAIREAGKHVVAHSEMAMTRDYLACTAADDILLAPGGRLYTFGLRLEVWFLAEAFEHLGISAQFIHIGEFKADSDRFVESSMTPAHRGMLESVRAGAQKLVDDRVGQRRALTSEQVRSLRADAPLEPRGAVRRGFVDGEAFPGDVSRWITDRERHTHVDRSEDRSDDVRVVGLDDWRSSRPRELGWKPLLRRRPRLAVVDLSGLIVMPGMTFPGASVVIDPDEVIPVLRKIRDDRRVSGLLLHINSGGGSAVASDMIWKAIEDVRARKPVVAYCSDVVGSGGYYLAVGADRIVCRPETIVGSIGVITGKFSGGDAARRHGVTTEAVYDEQSAAFTSMFEPLGERVLQNVQRDTRWFYRRFLQRVGQARDIPKRRLHRYARGRVYLGDEGLHRGLVDATSGLGGALHALADLCDVDLDGAEVKFVPHRKQSLGDLFRGSLVSTGAVSFLDRVIEPVQLAALLRRDPVLALSPFRIRFD